MMYAEWMDRCEALLAEAEALAERPGSRPESFAALEAEWKLLRRWAADLFLSHQTLARALEPGGTEARLARYFRPVADSPQRPLHYAHNHVAPRLAEFRAAWAEALLRAGRPEEALAALEEALGGDPGNARALVLLERLDPEGRGGGHV